MSTKSISSQSFNNEPFSNEPVGNEPFNNEPFGNEPVGNEPKGNEPIARKSTPGEPTVAERSAEQIVSDEFMIARAKILELAATLDRIERATGDVDGSRPMQLLVQGMNILCDDKVEKVKRVQLLMSRQYEPQWQSHMAMEKKVS